MRPRVAVRSQRVLQHAVDDKPDGTTDCRSGEQKNDRHLSSPSFCQCPKRSSRLSRASPEATRSDGFDTSTSACTTLSPARWRSSIVYLPSVPLEMDTARRGI